MGQRRQHVPATFKRPMKPGAVRGLQAAMAALYAPIGEPMRAEDALAECEQRRRDMEDRQRRQGELRLA